MKLFKEKYKTWEGANKRAQFERAMNPGEFARGDVARLYTYTVEQIDGVYRVAKHPQARTVAEFGATNFKPGSLL